jgi:hypothetical protein
MAVHTTVFVRQTGVFLAYFTFPAFFLFSKGVWFEDFVWLAGNFGVFFVNFVFINNGVFLVIFDAKYRRLSL